MFEKIKAAGLKNIIKVFAVVWFLITIIIMTITNVGLDDKWDWHAWLSNFLIIFGIMVFGLIMFESIGKDRQENSATGLYQLALREYNSYRAEIDPEIIYFAQFFAWYLPRELRNKKIEYLIKNNIEGTKAKRIVDYCDINDLADLKTKTITKKDKADKEIIIRKLTEEELPFVEEILKGKITLDVYSSSYYLSAFNDSHEASSVLEVGKKLEKQIKQSRNLNRWVKIGSSFFVSLALSILTVKEFMAGDDMQAWVNLISRISALITSSLSGWLSAVITVKLAAEQLTNKKNVLAIYHNSLVQKVFTPKTEDELGNEEIKKQNEELEEAKKNIIDPEVIPLKLIDSLHE